MLLTPHSNIAWYFIRHNHEKGRAYMKLNPSRTRAPSQYPKRRLFVRSREVSKPRDLYLKLSDRSEIWQALRQHCCRCACQISKRYDNLKYQSRGYETSWDLTKRRLFGYWDGAQVVHPKGQAMESLLCVYWIELIVLDKAGRLYGASVFITITTIVCFDQRSIL